MIGTIALIISGKELDLKEVERSIELCPNRIIEIGQKLPLKNMAKSNRWIYEKRFDENSFEKIINDFLNNILPFRENIEIFSKLNNVDLNIYINSDYGQFGFSLSKKQIKALESLNLKINFHIISFGMVEDNTNK